MSSTIIFDLFGVICPELGHTWIAREGLEDKRERLTQECFLAGDLNQVSEEEYWQRIAAVAGIPGLSIRDDWYKRITELPGMFAVIKDLRSSSKVVLCTNTAPWLFEEVDRRIGLRGRFDEIIKSCDEGIVKPNPEMYLLCLERTGAVPGSTMFIDDREENIRAAKGVGMHGIVFKNAETLSQELAAAGFAKKATS